MADLDGDLDDEEEDLGGDLDDEVADLGSDKWIIAQGKGMILIGFSILPVSCC